MHARRPFVFRRSLRTDNKTMTLAWYTPNQANVFSRVAPKQWMWPANAHLADSVQLDNLTALELVLRFGKRTTIHGLDRLLVAHSRRSERIFWLGTFIAAFLGTVYVCIIISSRFSAGHFQTVVDSTRFPVYRVPFPVITICNSNRLNWQRIDEAKQKFMPNENDTRKLKMFEQVVAGYDDIAFGHFDVFKSLQNEPLEQLNNINFSLVVEYMSWRCEEMLHDCAWRHFSYNCCEIFSQRRSHYGLCWAFNTLETDAGRQMQLKDPMWPWRTGSSGSRSGLSLRVFINPEKHLPNRTNEKGINVMVTEPLVWYREVYNIPSNTETMIDIEPIIYYYDNDTRSLSSDQRECIFDDETHSRDFKSLHGYVYMVENCEAECFQEYLVRYCNCTMDLLYPPGQYRSCRAQDLPCLARHNNNFLFSYTPGEERYVRSEYEGMACKCYRSCYSLNYTPDVRSSFLPPEIYGNVSYVNLDVHFRFETMMVYRTSLVFGWVDLMGIAGLFLGCSLISGMELAYFLCIEVPTFIIAQLKQKWRKRTIGGRRVCGVILGNNRNRFQHNNQFVADKILQVKSISQVNKWPSYATDILAYKPVIK